MPILSVTERIGNDKLRRSKMNLIKKFMEWVKSLFCITPPMTQKSGDNSANIQVGKIDIHNDGGTVNVQQGVDDSKKRR